MPFDFTEFACSAIYIRFGMSADKAVKLGPLSIIEKYKLHELGWRVFLLWCCEEPVYGGGQSEGVDLHDEEGKCLG